MYMWPKNHCLGSYCLKISHWCNLLLPVGVIYCSFIEYNYQKGCQEICSGKEFRSILLGIKVLENCIAVSHTSSAYNTASYAMLANLVANARHQLATAVQISLQVQSVMTMLRAHRV